MSKAKFLAVLVFYLFSLLGGLASETNAQEKIRSLAGAFEVELPSYTGQSGFSGGVQYSSKLEEANLKIGCSDRLGLSRAHRNNEFNTDELVLNYYNRFSRRGEKVSHSQIKIDGKSAEEFRYKLGSTFHIVRVLRVEDRIYALEADFPIDKTDELLPKVQKVFDTFKLLSEEIVRKEIERLIIESTPESFHSVSKPTKIVTDLVDLGLKGKPKVVLAESAMFGLDQWLMTKKPTKLQEFDELGYLTKEIEYDSYGLPYRIVIYGFIENKRVARVRLVKEVTRLLGISFPMSGKFDERFQEYYVYKYSRGKLIEQKNYFSNNALYSRFTYRHSKNTRTIEYSDGDSSPWTRIIEELNESGDVVKYKVYERDENKLKAKELYEVVYDSFDKEGNWTKRTIEQNYGLDGNIKMLGERVEYRTISYYE